jgi:hypothetical protein
MFFFNHHLYLKRSVFVIFLLVFCFVTSGLGVLAFPKPTEAGIPATVLADIPSWLDKILLAIWKAVLFPILKNIVITFLTSGDFAINWSEFVKWSYQELAFQTIEGFLNEAGLTLCSRFSFDIKIALMKTFSKDYSDQFPCTWEQSQLVQMFEEAIETESWLPIYRDGLKMFSLTARDTNNEFSRWWNYQDTVQSRIARREGDYRFELLLNNGFLDSRDCSKWRKELHDFNNDGEKQEEECPRRSLGGATAAYMNDRYGKIEGAMVETQAWSDVLTLLAMGIDTVLNDMVHGVVDEINEWKSSEEREAAKEIQEIKTQQKTGENNLIPVPSE